MGKGEGGHWIGGRMTYGSQVVDFNAGCVKADPKVLSFYSRLELKARMMKNGIEDDNEIFRPNPSITAGKLKR